MENRVLGEGNVHNMDLIPLYSLFTISWPEVQWYNKIILAYNISNYDDGCQYRKNLLNLFFVKPYAVHAVYQ